MCDKTEPPYDCCTWNLPGLDQIIADAYARQLVHDHTTLEPPADISWATFEKP